jgi:hypothetical protein
MPVLFDLPHKEEKGGAGILRSALKVQGKWIGLLHISDNI